MATEKGTITRPNPGLPADTHPASVSPAVPKVHLQPCANRMTRTGSGPGRPRLWGRSEGSGDKWMRTTGDEPAGLRLG